MEGKVCSFILVGLIETYVRSAKPLLGMQSSVGVEAKPAKGWEEACVKFVSGVPVGFECEPSLGAGGSFGKARGRKQC
jgi:hypothetical protein